MLEMPVFSIFDLITLIIAGIFVIIGIWKGFLKTVFKFGAAFLAVILAKFLGDPFGRLLFPELLKSDSAIGSKLSSATLEGINASLSSTLGTLILFVVLFIILRIIAGILAKLIVKGFNSKGLDRVLGGVLGLILAGGVIYVFALIVNIVALVMTFINPASDIYTVINNTVLFKLFF